MDTHYTLGASNTTFANNVVVGGGSAAVFGGPYTSPVWSGNIIWNTSAGSVPATGYASVNPLLVADANGIYHLASNSPAIGAAAGSYPLVTVDMDGQSRPGTGKDIGADQYSGSPATMRPLTPADVGPLSVALVTPAITSIQVSGTTSCTLTFSGPQAQTYQLQESSALTNWTTLSSGTFGSGVVTFTDTYTATTRRFYRVTSP